MLYGNMAIAKIPKSDKENKNMATQVKAGSGPNSVKLHLGRFYMNEAGERFEKAGDVDGKYTADAAYDVEISLPVLSELPQDIVEFAVLGNATRKAQEMFGSAFSKDKDADIQAIADKFMDSWFKILRGERERAEKEAVDSDATVALAKLAVVLKGKTDEQLLGASVPVNPTDFPLDKKGGRNYRAMAKVLKEQGHPWYVQAYKLASNQKGFE